MNNLQKFFTTYQLIFFFLLTYLLSWWSAPIMNGQIIPHGLAFAAIIVLALTTGKQGLGELCRRVTHWRVGWSWYLIAPGIVVAYLLIAFLVNLLIGAIVTTPPHLPASPILLELLLVGGLWEEPGWTGYALPKLQERFSNRTNGILIASLVLGVFRGIWHLPLLLYGHIPWFDVFLFSFAFQLIISWLYNRTHGSVLIVMLFHLSSNIIGGGIMSSVFTGNDNVSYYLLFVILAWIIALVLWTFSPILGSRERVDA